MLTVSGSKLADAITKLIKVCPDSADAVFVRAISKEVVEVRGYHEQRFAAFRIEAKCSSRFDFVCAGDRLKAICNKRGEMAFEKKGKSLTYKEKNYGGRLEIADIDVEFPSVNYTDTEGRLHDLLKKALTSTADEAALKNVYENKDQFFFIKVDGSGTLVALGDRFHMAHCHDASTKSKSELDFTIPSSYFNIMRQNFDMKKQDIVVKSEGHLIHFYNESCTITLPTVIPGDEDAKLETIIGAFDRFKSAKVLFTGTVDCPALSSLITNMEAMREKDKGLEIKIKFGNGLMQVRSETRHGSIKDSLAIDGKKEAEITFESSILQDVLSKIEAEAKITVFEGHVCRLENQKELKLNQYILLGIA